MAISSTVWTPKLKVCSLGATLSCVRQALKELSSKSRLEVTSCLTIKKDLTQRIWTTARLKVRNQRLMKTTGSKSLAKVKRSKKHLSLKSSERLRTQLKRKLRPLGAEVEVA